MRTRTRRPFKLIAFLSIIAPNLGVAEEASLHVNSSTPDIEITARVSDRSGIRLPKLVYAFRIEAECTAGQSPQSILLSVADTRKRISGDNLQAFTATAVTMLIPARQIAPLTIVDFCLARTDSDQLRADRVTVKGALSAQAALLCTDGNEEQMIYASLALDVTLHCIDEKLPVE